MCLIDDVHAASKVRLIRRDGDWANAKVNAF